MKSIIENGKKIAEISEDIKCGYYEAYVVKTVDGTPVNSFGVYVSKAKKWDKVCTEKFGFIDQNGFILIK